MTNVLEISNLGGGYNRRKIIDNVNIQIPKGSITALIGLNGAGKSTTIKHILGLLRPMEGEIKVNGITITQNNEKYRKSISYIPESPVLYEELTLEEHINKPPEALSTGTRRKAWFVCNLAATEPVWVLDEPFNGIDAETTNRMGELLKQQASDRLILLTSHSLPLNTQLIGNEPIGAFRLQGINYG